MNMANFVDLIWPCTQHQPYLFKTTGTYVCMASTDIQQQERSQSSYTICVVASSAIGLKLRVFGILPTTQSKTNKIFAYGAVFYACLSLRLNRSRCRWHMYLTYYSYIEKPKDPQFEPLARIEKWCRFWDLSCISSLVYLWWLHKYILNLTWKRWSTLILVWWQRSWIDSMCRNLRMWPCHGMTVDFVERLLSLI